MKKVLGLGNALVDILIKIDDDATLSKFNLPKGSMQLVDKNQSQVVLEGTKHLLREMASGGSAANTIHGLANLGIQTGFIGKIGKDDIGIIFENDLLNSNIKPHLLYSTTDSGLAAALISPDSERTFATFLGAAVEMTGNDLNPEIFDGYDYFHIEGYLVQNYELIESAIKLAKSKGLKVTLDLASYNVVEANLDFLKRIISEHVDIVFANEEEAKAFTGKDPESSLVIMSEMCEIAVVKIGKEGSHIKKGDLKHKVGVIDANPVDTTGAGDLYAAGFIYGLIHEYPLERCGEIGALLAGNVIEIVGPKISADKWVKIKHLISQL